MPMVISTVAALSTVYKKARNIFDPAERHRDIIRLIGKMPTIAAYSYRHGLGFPYVYPDNDLSYTENFMNMLWKMVEPKYAANPTIARALDILFILHADHEQNCSTNVMRSVGSSQADPFVSLAAAAAALSGPLHGGANEEVLTMLDHIGTRDNIPAFIDSVKAGRQKLMGFGHRVYKNYDPRARIIKWDRRPGVPGHGQESEARNRPRTGEDRPRGRVLREAAPLPERRLLLRHHVPGHGLSHRDVHRAVRDSEDGGLAGPVAGNWCWTPNRRSPRPRQIYTGYAERHYVPSAERTPLKAVTA